MRAMLVRRVLIFSTPFHPLRLVSTFLDIFRRYEGQIKMQSSDAFTHIDEDTNRLDEQHTITVETLGFLVHPNIRPISKDGKVADIGTGSGVWLLDVAKSLPSTCHFTGFDVSPSAFPSGSRLPPNVSFKTQDLFQPFPDSELGQYDLVAVRFVSSATTRTEWAHAIQNLLTLLKPGGWLQWIDSCNFTLYNTVAGTSRAACQALYDGLEPLRSKDDLVVGMMMREPQYPRRVEIWRELGLLDVHEDVFSTDRLHKPGSHLRELGTRNAIECFVDCLEQLVAAENTDWTKEKIHRIKLEAMKEINDGVYHTLDHVCIVGRKS